MCEGSEMSGSIAPSGTLQKAMEVGAQRVRMKVAEAKAKRRQEQEYAGPRGLCCGCLLSSEQCQNIEWLSQVCGVQRGKRSDVPVEHTTPASGRTAGEARVAAGTPLRRQKLVASSRVMVMKMERSGLLGKRLGS